MIYLASPYSTNADETLMEYRFQKTKEVVVKYLKQGYNVLSPVIYSHNLNKEFNISCEWDYWCKIDLDILKRCDELWVLTLPGYKESVGVQAEIKYASEFGIPIYYIGEAN